MRKPTSIASFAALASLASFVSLASLASFAPGCLPGDTRPVPERVDVTVEPSERMKLGIDTADGWRITFDRFLLAVGNIDFENDDVACNNYAEARYDRMFDFAVTGREKVGTVYGLGTCRVEFRFRAPSFDVLLGPGVTESDVAFMRTQATDRYADNDRVSLLAIGSAARGGEKKRFEWVFRRSYELTDCKGEGESFATTLELTEASSSELRLEVRPEELFRVLPDDLAELRFQPMADADTDADGVVTLDELSKATRPLVGSGQLGPGSDAGGAGGGGGAGGAGGTGGTGGAGPSGAGGAGGAGDAGDADAGGPVSLEGLVYEELLPRVVRVVGSGPCEVEDRRGR